MIQMLIIFNTHLIKADNEVKKLFCR